MNREISTDEETIPDFVNRLAEGKLLIPSFQREFVWGPEDIIKIWDSIYRFYPIGSILCWETTIDLNVARQLGGLLLPVDTEGNGKHGKRVYILDGQQRATSLFVSMYGGEGKVKGQSNFDFTLYFDATDATFFFANEFKKRKRKANPAFLIRLSDVPKWEDDFHQRISREPGFSQKIEQNLRQLSRVFSDYKLSFIRIKNFDVAAVCDIFERINQEGKDLQSIDIMVARTFRNYDFVIEEDM
ncbi:MAG: DUF262 domain-containing protein [Dehalococcoidia bacterium]